MPDRRDDTPTSPDTAARLEAIAARLRKRSTQLLRITGMQSLEMLRTLDLSLDDPRKPNIEGVLRAACQQAIDAAHTALSQELAEAQVEIDRLRAILRADLRGRSGSR